MTDNELSLQEVETRIEELDKLENFTEEERQEFIDLVLRRMDILDDIFYEKTGKRPIL